MCVFIYQSRRVSAAAGGGKDSSVHPNGVSIFSGSNSRFAFLHRAILVEQYGENVSTSGFYEYVVFTPRNVVCLD